MSIVLRAVNSAWFAYLTILLLQTKRIWGMWISKDLASGDTSYYFILARLWSSQKMDSFAWSPLYITFYGTILHWIPDAYAATITHRVVIVLVLALLILALMRRLLPGWIAWFLLAWWVVLPINFDSLYEVHLFALIPIVIAWLFVSCVDGTWGRGLCLATLLTTAVLMRNEVFVAFGLFGLCCLVYEVRAGWKSQIRSRLLSYALPLGVAVILCAFYYGRANDQWPRLKDMMDNKHTRNICQVYAFGYQQRHSDWTKSPWTDCQDLMQTTFGMQEPTLGEALRRNPKAMTEHLLWNASLVVNGLQALLFDAMSGNVNPDYAPVKSIPRRVIPLSVTYLLLIVAAGVIALRNRPAVWDEYVRPQIWTWAAMLSVVAVAPLIIVTQRPRPSYLFALSVFLMALAGKSLQVILGGRGVSQWARVAPWAALALIAFVPSYFWTDSPPFRPLLAMYRNLQPFEPAMGRRTVIVTPGYGSEVCNYFGRDGEPGCRGLYYLDLRSALPEAPLTAVLDSVKARFFYVSKEMMDEDRVKVFTDATPVNGWKTVAVHMAPDNNWAVYEKLGP